MTLAVPPGLGNVNPRKPAGLELKPYSENVMTLGSIVEGVQLALIVRDLTCSIPLQELEVLEIVVLALPETTLAVFDPEVVHPIAVNVIVVHSGPVPFVVRGGEKVNPPVIWVHVTLPVATPPDWLELELHPAAQKATTANSRRTTDPHPRRAVMTGLPCGCPGPRRWIETVVGFDHERVSSEVEQTASSIRLAPPWGTRRRVFEEWVV